MLFGYCDTFVTAALITAKKKLTYKKNLLTTQLTYENIISIFQNTDVNFGGILDLKLAT